ncbi:hypothetical protein Arub01_01140 [Actinomadura rubrobrunea]|uniref:Uncharacterized protein n=1 Tax=Actinomadura rubrobrunea TaxID=115335 RepID=A0A9W6PNZ5_9ACTN|nr:hypothetical protein Arub01_01140 [Actinomadura rubrobrunea]
MGMADGSAKHPDVMLATSRPQPATETTRRGLDIPGPRRPHRLPRARKRRPDPRDALPGLFIDTLHRLLNRAAAARRISRSASRLAMAWRLS